MESPCLIYVASDVTALITSSFLVYLGTHSYVGIHHLKP